MTTLEERAPAALDPVAALVGNLSRLQGAASDIIAMVGRNEPVPTRLQLLLAGALDDALASVEAYQAIAGTRPPVDMLTDPLSAFRLPSGRCAFDTVHADQVEVGDWVQRCHGDPDWHLVERAVVVTDPLTLTRMVNVWVENDGSYWWAPTDAIRRATPPADVVAGQERKAEAAR